MLAKKYEEHSHKIDVMIITQKLDGMRCIFLKENNIVTAYSREGKVINGLVEFESDFKTLPNNTMFDGELIAKKLDGEITADQFRRTIKLARTDGNKYGLEYYCFDWMPIEQFRNGMSVLKCIDRKSSLDYELNGKNFYTHIKALEPLYVGADKSKVAELLIEAEKNNLEGLMANNANSIYECKRSDSLLKVKTMQTVDLLCTGLEKGEGRLSDEVQEVLSLSGTYDYMLKIATNNIDTYNNFITNVLANTPNIYQYHSSIVLNEIKRENTYKLLEKEHQLDMENEKNSSKKNKL
jgi:ATP-dependent DNA ligase